MPEMDTENVSILETKVAGAGTPSSADINTAMDEFLCAFDDFKQANDQRLEEIEKRMSADVLTTTKVERINAALDTQKQDLDRLMLKAGRPHLAGETGSVAAKDDKEHKSAFDAYVRKGNTAPLLALESKALSVGSDPDGGYLVPDQTEAEIGRLLSDASPIRAISDVRQISASIYKKPFTTAGPATGWRSEERRVGKEC